MADATPSSPQPEPAPPGATPPSEPFDVKAKRLLAPFMPPADASQDTPELKMLRAIYILIAAALVLIIFCGIPVALISLIAR